MLRRVFVTSTLALCVAILPAQTKATAVRFGTLVDGRGHTTRDAVVVVEGDRITRVGTGNGAVPKGAEVIDLRKYTGIPGLIDLHTHITYYWDPDSGRKASRSPAAARSVAHGRLGVCERPPAPSRPE